MKSDVSKKAAVAEASKSSGSKMPAETKKWDLPAQTQGGPPLLVGLFSIFRANAPQLYVDLNRSQCMTMDVPLGDAFDTLQIYLGSLYVNDFNRFGRTWQVVAQADAKYRNEVDDVKQLKVRNRQGAMVPIGALATVEQRNGPFILTRYNMYPAAAINGNAGPGVSSGQAINLMQNLADRELRAGMRYEWTEIAYQELQAGNTAMSIFGLAVLGVFLVLAAQYESWSLPMAVILVVPMCLLSAIGGVMIGRSDVNIFTQIGFVVLVGLASKNAILIVEFARRQRAAGMTRRQAAMEACQLRLRPIVMTSLAFILGVVPLLIAHGAGAEMRRTLGLAVFSGMLGVTLFGIFLTPVFFNVIDWLGETEFFASPETRFVGKIVLIVLAFLVFFPVGLWMLWRFAKDSKPNATPDDDSGEQIDR
jgi:multidrug efflux pump